jgi:hypothetical protein
MMHNGLVLDEPVLANLLAPASLTDGRMHTAPGSI